MEELQKYTMTFKRGIDDLKCEFAFSYIATGENYHWNEIKFNSKSYYNWSKLCSFENVTIDIIEKESNRIKQENKDYVEQLYKENRYGELYKVTINSIPNPNFDKVFNHPALSDHRLIFIDMSNYNGEPNIKEI